MINLEYLRQFRIAGFTLFDSSLALVGVLLLAPLLTKLAKKVHLNLTTRHWLWLMLPLSVITHLLVGTQTPLVEAAIDPSDHYFIKALLLVMLFMGLKDIRKKKK